MLWVNPSVHYVNTCHYGWFNKQAKQSIAEQDKVKWESQTEKDGMKKGTVTGVASQSENKQNMQNGIEVKAVNLEQHIEE